MGTESEEAEARTALERAYTERMVEQMRRQEEARKAAEEAAKNQGQNSMTAAGAAVGWPDNEVQPAAGRLDAVAGALGVGKAGDAALAQRLLNSGQAPAGGRSTAAAEQADGAKARISGALGVRGATPAVER
jgi:hypothetical protein